MHIYSMHIQFEISMAALSTQRRKSKVIKIHSLVDSEFYSFNIQLPSSMMCKEHKIRCRYQFVSLLTLALLLSEDFRTWKLTIKTMGKTRLCLCSVQGFLCGKLVFKYLVVMTSNYASSGPKQTESGRAKHKGNQQRVKLEKEVEQDARSCSVKSWGKDEGIWLVALVNKTHALLVHCALSVISSVAQ